MATLADEVTEVDTVARVAKLTRREKLPMIYHEFNITKPDSSLNVQLKVEDIEDTR